MNINILKEIKDGQQRLNSLIEELEKEINSNFFEYQDKRIPLKPGERYVGTIITADGSHNHHIILLPGEQNNVKWQAAMNWAASIGGKLPDRFEAAMLFVTMKEEFQTDWYWLCEQHFLDMGRAWCNHTNGYQTYDEKNTELRACAIRRLIIK